MAQSTNEILALTKQVNQLYAVGKYKEATLLAKRALKQSEKIYGAEHPTTLANANDPTSTSVVGPPI
jgi:hypothetical protein